MKPAEIAGGLLLLLVAGGLALGFSGVSGWAARMNSTLAEEARRSDLRADDARHVDALRARLMAEAGLEQLAAELRRASQGGQSPTSPLEGTLRTRNEHYGYDGYAVEFEKTQAGWQASAMGRVAGQERESGAARVFGECTISARLDSELVLSVESTLDTTPAPPQ